MNTKSLIELATQALTAHHMNTIETEPSALDFQNSDLFQLIELGLTLNNSEFQCLINKYSKKQLKTALTALLDTLENKYIMAFGDAKNSLWERFTDSEMSDFASVDDLLLFQQQYLSENHSFTNLDFGINNGLDPFIAINHLDQLELTITLLNNIDFTLNAPITPLNVDLDMTINSLLDDCVCIRNTDYQFAFTDSFDQITFKRAKNETRELLSDSTDKKAALKNELAEIQKGTGEHFVEQIGYVCAYLDVTQTQSLGLTTFIKKNKESIAPYIEREIGTESIHTFSIFADVKASNDQQLEDYYAEGDSGCYEAVSVHPCLAVELMENLAWNHALALLTLTFLQCQSSYLANDLD
ncbi:hypothetical protein A6E01_19800 (plasmid) [Vibrio breoganii]|uniref:Uncharacterized protein n=1 Tax=Vibrio breoganii TaxID=553239 RepID=A0AAN0XZF7_9VIBR|nr:hypothetical protein [Vibrio breoganii]ANO35459.1 hypothetical protein A6E01_19800 [Vibrio breoganii]PML13938.1 hypothetical protein BCT84_12320 [Vibrio breoganii]